MFVPDKRKEGNGAKREGRMFQILTFLYEEKIRGVEVGEGTVWVSSTKIAHAIGMSPSWYVRDLLIEMASQRWIIEEDFEKGNGAIAYTWRIADKIEFSEKWGAAFMAWYPEIQQALPMGGA